MAKNNFVFQVLNAHFPWILMMFLLTVQSAIASNVLKVSLFSGLDKIIHFVIFGVLGWLLSRGIDKKSNIFVKKNMFWIITIIIAAFATFDELHQSSVPGRYADIKDWISDVAGAVIFMLIYRKKMMSKGSGKVENL